MTKKILIIFSFIFLISGCNQDIEQTSRWRWYINFQTSDIIFNSISENKEVDYFGENVLGFYMFEDQSVTEIDLGGGNAPTHPYYLDATTIMTANKLGNYGIIHEGIAYLFIFSKVQYLSCDKLIGYGYPYNGNIVFVGNEGISLVNRSDCSIMRTFLTNEDLSVFEGQDHFGTNFLSSNEDFILMDIDFKLIRLSLPEKEIYYFDKIGTSPSLSPDQTKIAYIAPDGIHIMHTDGDNDRLVAPYIAFGNFDNAIIPTVNWSNNSKKIVYHKCTLSAGSLCDDINDYSIFMYDLETETETFLLQGGMNPSWGWGK